MGCGSDAETRYTTTYKGGFWELRFSPSCRSSWLRVDMADQQAVVGRGYVVGYRCSEGSGDCRGDLESRPLSAGRGYTDMISTTSYEAFRVCYAASSTEVAGPFDDCGSPVRGLSSSPAVETVRQADLVATRCSSSPTPEMSLNKLTVESVGNFVIRSIPRYGKCDTGQRFSKGMRATVLGRTGEYVLIETARTQGWVHEDSYREITSILRTEPLSGTEHELAIRAQVMGSDGVLDLAEHTRWVDRLSFGMSLDAFFLIKEDAVGFEFLDWSDDGCSGPTPQFLEAEQLFTDSCLRHDFCYRNNRILGRTDLKESCDVQMGVDMARACEADGLNKATCERWATTYFSAVVTLGKIQDHTPFDASGWRNRYMCPHSGFYELWPAASTYLCRRTEASST